MRLRTPTRGLRWYFDHNDGHLIDKWSNYFPIYERHLSPYRGTRNLKLLEIGVSHGGSLQMWRRYFGRSSTIVGIDIEPRITALAEPGIELHVGDQSDPAFLDRLVARYGAFDIVIDDGSHWPNHQLASVEHLWPHVRPGGLYLVEDLHTNYWPEYESGRGQPHTFMAWVTQRIDDLHAFHSHQPDFEPNGWTRTVAGIHVYDSIVVLDRATVLPPVRQMTGRPAFDDIYGYPADTMINADHRQQLHALSSPSARLRRAWRDPRGTLRRATSRLR